MSGLRQILWQSTRPLVYWGRAALRFVFPPSCPLCHADVEFPSAECGHREVSPMLCGQCLSDVLKPRGNRCFRCGLPVGPFIRSEQGCPQCAKHKFRFQRVVRFGVYDDSLRQACIRAKATTQFPLAAALANLLWLTEQADLDGINVDVIAPVPCHWTRRLMRPHHAAETISRVLAWRMGKPLDRRLLRKKRLTPDQSDLSAAQRRLNLKGAFAIRPFSRSLTGKTVLLIDDILTTGTTANECARTLLRAGAKQVYVAVIAVVP